MTHTMGDAMEMTGHEMGHVCGVANGAMLVLTLEREVRAAVHIYKIMIPPVAVSAVS